MKLLQSIYLAEGVDIMLTRSNTQNKYTNNETLTAHDMRALKGAFYELVYSVQEEMGWSNEEAYNELTKAAFCDNVLYLGSFEGYPISEKITLRGLYLNKNNSVMALLETANNNFIYGIL